jgi:hypothetical protein
MLLILPFKGKKKKKPTLFVHCVAAVLDIIFPGSVIDTVFNPTPPILLNTVSPLH